METITLDELFGPFSSLDENELLVNCVDPDCWETRFTVKEMRLEELRQIRADESGLPIIEAFEKYASRDQRRYVRSISRKDLAAKVIVMDGEMLLDGFHHTIKAIQTVEALRCIDISESVDT